MSQFRGTAPFYRAYRPGIPHEVAEHLIAAANRDATATTLLDLGTGTGQVIRALRHHFADIIAVDLEQELLDLAEKDLSPLTSSDARIRLVCSTAEKYEPPEGWTASLVTICRAFHWMNQPVVLDQLAHFTQPTGVVAIFGDHSIWTSGGDWARVVRSVIQDFLGQERRAGNGTFSHHDKPYSQILAESPFSDVEETAIPVQRTWTTETILGYLYSTSFAAQHLFGGQLAEFENEIKRALNQYSKEGIFIENNKFTIILGRRR